MKCALCVDEVYARVKQSHQQLFKVRRTIFSPISAEDRATILAQVKVEVNKLPEAITASGTGPKCLEHYIQIGRW